MLFTGLGRSVWEKTVPLVLRTALGLRPRAVLKTSGTVFSHTDLPPGKLHIYILNSFRDKRTRTLSKIEMKIRDSRARRSFQRFSLTGKRSKMSTLC